MPNLEFNPAIHTRTDPSGAAPVARLALAAATISAGLGAGVGYTYQVSVTRALAEIDDDAYVATFQSINETILNPWFTSVFVGTVPLIAASLALNRRAAKPVAALVATGLACQAASIAVTVFGNIPLNDKLARAGAVTGEAASTARADFEAPWNRLHLARTLLSVAGFVSLGIASVLRSRD